MSSKNSTQTLRSRTPFLALLCLLLSGTLAGCSDGDDPDPDPTPEAALDVSSGALDFGEVPVGSREEKRLDLFNSGASKLLLTVTLPGNPAGQYSVVGQDGTIPDQIAPGTTVALTVRFAPAEGGDAPGILRIDSTDPITPRIDIALSAEGLEVFQDEDEDGVAAPEDCDDEDPEVYPGAQEVCDRADNDCDGTTDEAGRTYYRDADLDGFGIQDTSLPGSIVSACTAPPGYAPSSSDCDDLDPAVHPGASEVCDEKDNDCDGVVDEGGTTPLYLDQDGDGFGASATVFQGCRPGPGVVLRGDDCDDGAADSYPGASEACDGRDNDCDGAVDDGALSTYYADLDGDGFGDERSAAQACAAPEGFVALAGDCDDLASARNPAALEVCDGADNDCDGAIDSGLELTFYFDGDGDGFGDASDSVQACARPAGYVTNDQDCNDDAVSARPGAQESCDTLDNDCDGQVDEGVTQPLYLDADRDGHGTASMSIQACDALETWVLSSDDCDDSSALIHPGAVETCDSRDNDCDKAIDEDGSSTFYLDYDKDGFGDGAISKVGCNNPGGYVSRGDDCNDREASIFPGAQETCNSRDDDCDSRVDEGVLIVWYQDADRDGYGNLSESVQACSRPGGSWSDDVGDCNDLDPAINPLASEVCDEVDNDCDGARDEGVQTTFFDDGDRDGFGDPSEPVLACVQPSSGSENDLDCDDMRADVNPEAPELCDQIDNNCDRFVDEGATRTFFADEDRDGYGVSSSTVTGCEPPAGYAESDGDCNDADGRVSPSSLETCDGRDNDCDGSLDEGVLLTVFADVDGDRHGDPESSSRACEAASGLVYDGHDCDDLDADIHPGASERCDGLDNDCDGNRDEAGDVAQPAWYPDGDGDGYGVDTDVKHACSQPSGFASRTGDCADADGSTFPGAQELCDGGDHNCDGRALPVAAPRASNNGPVCLNGAVQLNAAAIDGATWRWTGPDGFTSSLQNPFLSGMTVKKGGVYSVTATVEGCASPAGTTEVVVNSPDSSFEWLPAVPRRGEQVQFSPELEGAAYSWTFQNGSPSVSASASPMVSWGSNGAFAVALTVTYNGCSTTSTNVVNVVDPTSCKQIKTMNPAAADGTYTIDPDGSGGTAPFSVYCDMTTSGGGWTRCLEFKNTNAEDLNRNDWFDTCVNYSMANWTGQEVMTKLSTSNSKLVYSATGSRSTAWSYDQLTSTATAGNQYYSYNHGAMIELSNGDRLMITGRSSTNNGCGGSMGNGYGIVIYPSIPDYYSNPKLFVMPYRHQVGRTDARFFTGWSTGAEISYSNGESFNSCGLTPGFNGTFEFYVR